VRPPARWILAALLLAGCATPGGLSSRLDGLSARGEFEQAAALVEGARLKNYGGKNALLYSLDRGMLLHLAGRWADSNASFEEAKGLARELYTKSVTNQAASFLVSDNVRPYAGEDFERAQVHLFSAVNYLMLGKGGEALVEARQVDFLLTKLRTDLGHKNVYTEDAFARGLMGLIYEDQGAWNDAYVSYYKALEAYDRYAKDYGLSAPPQLAGDAVRTAERLGMREQAEEVRKRWGGKASSWPKGAGEVVVLHYQGIAPRKVDSFFEIAVAKGFVFVDAQRPVGEEARDVEKAKTILRAAAADQMVRVAFPSFEPVPYEVRGLTVRAEGAPEAAAAPAQDIGAIAVKNLKDRIGRERAKAIARALVKWSLTQKAAEKVEKNRGEGAAWLVKTLMQAASAVTETADKRSWTTLPDKIGVARLFLPEGAHDLKLTFRTAAGAAAGEEERKGVQVRAGHRTFLIVRTVK
jgi:uncharacterized protein